MTGLRVPGGTEPERLADNRPAERPLLTPDEDDDEHELPDETGGKANEQRLYQRHVLFASEAVLESGSHEPGQRRHGEGRGSPDGQDLQKRVLRNLDGVRRIAIDGGFFGSRRIHGVGRILLQLAELFKGRAGLILRAWTARGRKLTHADGTRADPPTVRVAVPELAGR